jgi:hypothetical protein
VGSAPGPAATGIANREPVGEQGREGRGPRGQTERTFLVARVARAASTMSSKSFFMPAMVANVRVVRSFAAQPPPAGTSVRVDPLDVTSSPHSVPHRQRRAAAF